MKHISYGKAQHRTPTKVRWGIGPSLRCGEAWNSGWWHEAHLLWEGAAQDFHRGKVRRGVVPSRRCSKARHETQDGGMKHIYGKARHRTPTEAGLGPSRRWGEARHTILTETKRSAAHNSNHDGARPRLRDMAQKHHHNGTRRVGPHCHNLGHPPRWDVLESFEMARHRCPGQHGRWREPPRFGITGEPTGTRDDSTIPEQHRSRTSSREWDNIEPTAVLGIMLVVFQDYWCNDSDHLEWQQGWQWSLKLGIRYAEA
jgi:hypothetical protein